MSEHMKRVEAVTEKLKAKLAKLTADARDDFTTQSRARLLDAYRKETEFMRTDLAQLREEVASLRQQIEACPGPCADLNPEGGRLPL